MRYASDRRLAIRLGYLVSYSYNILVAITQVSHGKDGYKIAKRPAQEDASK